MGLHARIKMARLYLATDTSVGKGFGAFCRDVFAAGVDVLQIREPGISDAALQRALDEARAAAFSTQALVAVSGNAELAGRMLADVLHLGAADGKPKKARRHLHEYAMVGVSTHSVAQADAAQQDETVDYLTVGPVYADEARLGRAAPGLGLVRAIAADHRVADPGTTPWFAVGGITAANLDDVLAAGARRVLVTDAITGAADPAKAAGDLAAQLRAAWSGDTSLADYAFTVFGQGPRATLCSESTPTQY